MRTILITGASTGIGESFVRQAALLEETTIIVLTKHPVSYAVPKNVELHQIDLTDFKKVNALMKQIAAKHLTIDVLINNAGNGWRGMIEDTTIEEAKEQLDLNVWALVNLTQQVLPLMRKAKKGHIINVSSVATTINYGTIGYYSATKAFIEKISEVLAIEVAPWNIHVSLVAPGAVRTKFGHNMINIQRYDKGAYKDEYRSWAHKFEVMFQKPLTSDAAAKKLIGLLDNPRPYSFLTARDAFYCYAKKIIPRKIFDSLLLRRYMHL